MCIRDRDKALEYVRTPHVQHTANEWQTTEHNRHIRSNRAVSYTHLLTVTEEVEIRYRTETRTDSEGNEYDVEVPYNYYICLLYTSWK